jgi:hypothetical protein
MSSDVFNENDNEPLGPMKGRDIFNPWAQKQYWWRRGHLHNRSAANHNGFEDSRDRSWTIHRRYEDCLRAPRETIRGSASAVRAANFAAIDTPDPAPLKGGSKVERTHRCLYLVRSPDRARYQDGRSMGLPQCVLRPETTWATVLLQRSLLGQTAVWRWDGFPAFLKLLLSASHINPWRGRQRQFLKRWNPFHHDTANGPGRRHCIYSPRKL